MVNIYKRKIGFYVIEGSIKGNIVSDRISYDKLIDVIEFMAGIKFPLGYNYILKRNYSLEKIPLISDVFKIDEDIYGGVIGYLRKEGLSHVYDERTGQHSPLILNPSQGLFELVHFVVVNVNNVPVIALEHASFAPRHGVISRLLTDGLHIYCKERMGALCEKGLIHLRKLYRPHVEALLMNYDVVRGIRIKAESNMIKKLKDRVRGNSLGSKLIRGLISFLSFLRGRYIEAGINVGRARNDYILTIEDVFSLYEELTQYGDIFVKFEVTVKGIEGTHTFDLVNEALMAEVSIKKAIYEIDGTKQISKCTDTGDAITKISNTIERMESAIRASVEKYLESNVLRI